ncbi:MAG: hypothetical protein MUF28_15205 [Ignavibacterium sp.]|nr:hypothetical protein [Ignavibacterium sp.]
MQKSFQIILWCISFALIVSTSGFAQDSKVDNDNTRSPYAVKTVKTVVPVYNVEGTSALLWDNFLTQSGTGIVAGEWGGLPVGSNQVIDADDFLVPSAATWTIDQIAATGFYNVGEASSWGVAFYSDNAGVPGTLIQVETVTVVPTATEFLTLINPPI